MEHWIKVFFSNIGKRETNQDFIIATSIKSKRRKIELIIVCDGVGGRPNGKECSEVIGSEILKQIKSFLRNRKSKLSLNNIDAGKLVKKLSNLPTLGAPSSSRTTFSLLLIDKKETSKGFSCLTIWAGDSRIYSIDSIGSALQISNDQYDENNHLAVVFGGDGKLHGKLGHSFFITKNPLLFCLTSDGMNSQLKGLFKFFVACVYYNITTNKEFEYQSTKYLGNLVSDNYSAALVYRIYSKSTIRRVYKKISLQ